MRGPVEGLASPHPLAETLPEIYREVPFTSDLMAVFDDALAPVFSVLDNLEAYLDPCLTPADFLDWLGGWFGLAPDGTWIQERYRRERISRAVELFTSLGTVAGMKDYIAIYFHVHVDDVDIHETGGVLASRKGGEVFPGHAEAALRVRLRLPHADPDAAARLDAIVVAIKPAHLAHRVEVVAK